MLVVLSPLTRERHLERLALHRLTIVCCHKHILRYGYDCFAEKNVLDYTNSEIIKQDDFIF